MECTVENNKLVPLSKAVSASIIDTYGDIGVLEQRYSHWACRELKNIYMQTLPKLRHKVWLTVNPNTHTATLPLDWSGETFVGYINEHWQKIGLKLNNQITDTKNIVDIPCETACPKCQQDTNICNDLTITEDTEIVVIDDTPYNKTIIKKLYPNGDYYLETTTPILNIDDDEVEYVTSKQFITNFSLKPCGCLEVDERNTQNLITFCPEIYCNYFAPYCGQCQTSYGGYKIFEESGLIQMAENYPFAKVYIEYNGFITKIKGQYYVPYVAFETIVEGTKLRAIKNKKNVQRWQVLDQKNEYREAKGNMTKILGRASLQYIIQKIAELPKFDVDYGYDYWSCFNSQSSFTVPTTASNLAAVASMGGGGSGGGGGTGPCSIVNNNYITINNNSQFTLAVKVDGNPGSPVAGATSYQNNLLIGASNVTWLLLAKQVLSLLDGDFTIDYGTGIISIAPNQFIFGDSLIVNYDKNS